MRRPGVRIPSAPLLSSPGTSLTPVPGLCLLFEREAFGHSALSGCSLFGSWFDFAWLLVDLEAVGEFAGHLSGFDIDDVVANFFVANTNVPLA